MLRTIKKCRFISIPFIPITPGHRVKETILPVIVIPVQSLENITTLFGHKIINYAVGRLNVPKSTF